MLFVLLCNIKTEISNPVIFHQEMQALSLAGSMPTQDRGQHTVETAAKTYLQDFLHLCPRHSDYPAISEPLPGEPHLATRWTPA